jgi:hypothetical protein
LPSHYNLQSTIYNLQLAVVGGRHAWQVVETLGESEEHLVTRRSRRVAQQHEATGRVGAGVPKCLARQPDHREHGVARQQVGADGAQPLVGQHAAGQHQRHMPARPRQLQRTQQKAHLAGWRRAAIARPADAIRRVADHQVERCIRQAGRVQPVGMVDVRQPARRKRAG